MRRFETIKRAHGKLLRILGRVIQDNKTVQLQRRAGKPYNWFKRYAQGAFFMVEERRSIMCAKNFVSLHQKLPKNSLWPKNANP